MMLFVSMGIFSVELSTNNATIFKIAAGIIITGFLPVVEVVFAFACLFGAGYSLSIILLKESDRGHLGAYEFLYLCILLGAMLVAGIFFLLGVAGVLYWKVILCLKIIFSLIGGINVIKILSGKISLDPDLHTARSVLDTVFPFTVFFCILLVLFCTATSPVIHGDAMHYHYALPWLYLQNHAIYFYPTNPSSGKYLSGELLYLLTLHADDSWNVFSTNLLNACLESSLFAAIFFSVRRNKVSSHYAYVACIFMLSVPAIGLWGHGGKNDLFIAGLCLSVLWLFRLYQIYRTDGWLYTMFLLGGFAISVKILAAPALILGSVLLLLFFIKKGLGIKKYLVACGIASIPVAPWMLYAFYYRGNPIFPVADSFFNHSGYFNSEYYIAASTARNANGLVLTIENFFGQIFPLLAGTSKFSSGSYTSALGYFFIAAMVIGALYLYKKGVRAYSYYWILGTTNLLILSAYYFETFLLMRYYIFTAAAIFVFLVTAIAYSRDPATPFQKSMHIIVAIFALNSGPMMGWWHDLKDNQNRIKYLSRQISRDDYIKTFSGAYEHVYDLARKHLKPGEKVLIHDGMFFGLQADALNVHPLHGDYVRYDKMDVSQFESFMKEERVSVVLIHSGFSGITPQLQGFLKNKMNLETQASPYELYVLKDTL